MKLLTAAVVLVSIGLATSDKYNFNSIQHCSKGKTYKKTLDDDDTAIVVFRQPGTGAGAKVNKFFGTIPDRCSMEFSPRLISFNDRISVRFDPDRREINDDSATITFYDDDEVSASKKIMEVSKNHPVTANSSFTTKGRYLTIEVYRDYDNSKDYNVEMIIEPSGSATAARWSCAVAVVAVFIRYIL